MEIHTNDTSFPDEPEQEDYYEVQMLPLGRDSEDYLTADEDTWISGPEVWNIWVTARNDAEGRCEEVLDLDIPISFPGLANAIYSAIDEYVDVMNAAHESLEELT